MRALSLGPGEDALRVPRVAYGCLPLGRGWDGGSSSSEALARAKTAIATALECGINFFDHADIYGRGQSELVFARAVAELGVRRGDLLLQSKCGIRPAEGSLPHRFDSSYEHIMSSAEQSLRRLGTDYLDVYLLHRPDALVEPEEVARAFDALATSGKVRHFGVSNHSAPQMELLARSLTRPLVTNQLELSLAHTALIDAGITMNQNKSATGVDGLLDYCRLSSVTLQAWSPLAKGRALGGDSDDRARGLARVVTRLGKEKGVAPEAIPIAWLLRHPAGFQPVIGSSDPGRIVAAASGDSTELSREEWYELYAAARGERLP
jgi:predicted oxidoreductase